MKSFNYIAASLVILLPFVVAIVVGLSTKLWEKRLEAFTQCIPRSRVSAPPERPPSDRTTLRERVPTPAPAPLSPTPATPATGEYDRTKFDLGSCDKGNTGSNTLQTTLGLQSYDPKDPSVTNWLLKLLPSSTKNIAKFKVVCKDQSQQQCTSMSLPNTQSHGLHTFLPEKVYFYVNADQPALCSAGNSRTSLRNSGAARAPIKIVLGNGKMTDAKNIDIQRFYSDPSNPRDLVYKSTVKVDFAANKDDPILPTFSIVSDSPDFDVLKCITNEATGTIPYSFMTPEISANGKVYSHAWCPIQELKL